MVMLRLRNIRLPAFCNDAEFLPELGSAQAAGSLFPYVLARF